MTPSKTAKKTAEDLEFGVLNESLGYLIRQLQLQVYSDFNKFFSEYEVTPAQFAVLEVLANNPGIHATPLANALGIKRPNLVGLLDKLALRDFIERRPFPTDPRAHALYLTDTGEKLMAKLHECFYAHENGLKHKLGEDNFAQFRQQVLTLVK
jgi:DNA-binding MarR family transcriptional regulator